MTDLTLERKPRRLKSSKSTTWRNIASTVRVGEVLEQAANTSHSIWTLVKLGTNVLDQSRGLGLGDSSWWEHSGGASDPSDSLLWHQLDELKEDAAAVSEAVTWERDHHAGHDSLDEVLAAGDQEIADGLLDLWWVWLSSRAWWVVAAESDDVAKVVECSGQRIALLQGQGRDSSLQDGWEKLRWNEAVWIVQDSISEKAEEVLDNIRKLAWLKAGHNAKGRAGLRLKEVVNGVDGLLRNMISILRELAKDTSSDPKETSLLGLLEALGNLLCHLWKEWLHGGAV